jgi:hypothetical protein
MHPVFIVVLVVVILLIDIPLVIFVLRRRAKGGSRINPHWQWLAERFGLQIAGGEPYFPKIRWLGFLKKPIRLEGTYRNSLLKVYHYTVSTGNSSTTYATARLVGANPKGLAFRVSREGVLTRLGKSLGMQDIETGDPRFDKLFVLKSNDPAFIKSALLPEIRGQLCDVWDKHDARGAIALQGEELFYQEVGTIRNEKTRERFAALIDAMVPLHGIVEFYNRA